MIQDTQVLQARRLHVGDLYTLKQKNTVERQAVSILHGACQEYAYMSHNEAQSTTVSD